MASMGFTGRSSHRPGEGAVGLRPDVRRASAGPVPARSGSGDGDGDRSRAAGRIADRVGPRRKLAEVDDGPLGLGDLDADHVLWAVSLAQGDVEGLGVGSHRDDDRIEDVAGLDAAGVVDRERRRAVRPTCGGQGLGAIAGRRAGRASGPRPGRRGRSAPDRRWAPAGRCRPRSSGPRSGPRWRAAGSATGRPATRRQSCRRRAPRR